MVQRIDVLKVRKSIAGNGIIDSKECNDFLKFVTGRINGSKVIVDEHYVTVYSYVLSDDEKKKGGKNGKDKNRKS